jgi:beta-carotene hydroxylase
MTTETVQPNSSNLGGEEKSTRFLGTRGADPDFRSLCRAPTIAWPTIILFLISSIGCLGTAYVAFMQILPIPYWLASVIIGFFAYLQFSVGHDAAHRAVSTHKWFNELMGNMAVLFLAPFANVAIIRRVHMQHHVYANGPKDPDNWTHDGSIWTALLRWATLDVNYAYYYLRYQQPRPLRELMTVAVNAALVIIALSALIYFGYGEEALWLWFIPTRIGIFLVSAVFVFLPHHPHEVAQNEDPYRATTIRLGMEWLLTPLLAYQNYHLMHHLYPTAPFYNNVKLWEIKSADPEFMAKNPAVVSAFSFKPNN